MSALRTAFLPRPLHPGAWWLWAIGLATAASRTTNPLLLLLLVAAAGYVVAARRTPAPWSRSYAAFLRLGLLVIALRVALQLLFGSTGAGHVLVTLPQLPLPSWAAGVSIGGPVTAEALLGAVYEGLRLATILACVGAANSLANPSRLLRVVPGALYEVGVAVVVAMTLAPQLVTEAGRLRQARRLRGRPDRGLRSVAGVALPLLESSLDRSLQLAAAMDSRGYGRTAGVPRATRRATGTLVLLGLAGAALGTYGLLDGGSPQLAGLPLLGWPVLLVGMAAAAAGFVLGGRRVGRSRYRPDPWALPEWLVTGSGVGTAVAFLAAAAADPTALAAPVSPPGWPGLPLLPLLGVLLALAPAWAAPPVPATRRSGSARQPAAERVAA